MRIINIYVRVLGTNSFVAINKNISGMIWFVLFILSVLFSFSKENLLPSYFFFDANTIFYYMSFVNGLVPFDSYASTAAFYNFFSVDRDSYIFPIVSSVLLFSFFWLTAIEKRDRALSLFEFLLYCCCLFLSIIYMTLLSKDFIVFLLVFVFYLLSKRSVNRAVIFWILVSLMYAYYFRVYWIICISVFVSMYLILIMGMIRKPIYFFLLCSLYLLFFAITFKYFLGIDIDNYRVAVNDVRLELNTENAKTMITPLINSNGVITGWLNVLYVLVTFFIPLPLLQLLSPYYIFISVFVMGLQIKMIKELCKEIKKNKEEKDKRVIAYVCIIFSFIIVQSLFEPDYGSYVRHLSPFYPLFFYLIIKNKKVK